ncbi:MAG: tRNA (adenosine(37)-N6)-threonylcarbamoyltransferase complex dimerization subunit type 1 TsaB [Chitinophagaceae bacterium]|nr:tRNA (adenosine(37)-N6)-threonylcarbamoyltransferase complex dimerization subunit type 1 TsaB [Chitinophagaceae bacterium]
MSCILNIDTASELATISMARDGLLISSLSNGDQKDHAAFLQPGISQLCLNSGIPLSQVDAVAVSAGPGSYTGLRVGMASAKGLCYALSIPFITLDTLQIAAFTCLDQQSANERYKDHLLCPMIDARRMEVFTAVYDHQLNIILPPAALVLDEHSFTEQLHDHAILFFGSGSDKWRSISNHPNVTFVTFSSDPKYMCRLSEKAFDEKNFTQLADSQPLYLKEFHFTTKK